MTVTVFGPRTNVATIKSISGEWALCALPGVSRLIALHVSQAGVSRWTQYDIGRRYSYQCLDNRERRQIIGACLIPEGNHEIDKEGLAPHRRQENQIEA